MAYRKQQFFKDLRKIVECTMTLLKIFLLLEMFMINRFQKIILEWKMFIEPDFKII